MGAVFGAGGGGGRSPPFSVITILFSLYDFPSSTSRHVYPLCWLLSMLHHHPEVRWRHIPENSLLEELFPSPTSCGCCFFTISLRDAVRLLLLLLLLRMKVLRPVRVTSLPCRWATPINGVGWKELCCFPRFCSFHASSARRGQGGRLIPTSAASAIDLGPRARLGRIDWPR